MIASIVPLSVVTVEAPPSDEVELLPAEAACIARAVPARRDEFALGRRCARQALARFSIREYPLLAGPFREPVWPSGIVGSITHCSGYTAASVASESSIRALGIDAEREGAVGDTLVESVCTPKERCALETFGREALEWATVLFSAKEAVYKAYYPTARRILELHDVEISIDRESMEFEARILREPAIFESAPLRGRIARDGTRVYTAVVVR